MGFFDTILGVGASALKAVNERNQKFADAQDKYESYSDEKLAKIVKDKGFFAPSQIEKSAAFKILKERGLTPEDIKYL
jgi:hypothetical protein